MMTDCIRSDLYEGSFFKEMEVFRTDRLLIKRRMSIKNIKQER